ncbi:MAG TPA: GNAT family N-acetyltransferase [Allosphingosinicella sp.]|nr:GNAT family N-acetyltransferase [Allosphingosinicella sp.]
MDIAANSVRVETERLVLRLYRQSDFADLHAMSADPAMWTYSERTTMSSEEAWARLLRNCGHWALSGYGVFAIEEKATGLYVGEAGCSDYRRRLGTDFDASPEASWAIVPAAQGRGYAAEAAQAALSWVDEALNPEQTVCLIHEANLPSLKVAEKLGFKLLRRVTYRGYPAILFRRRSPAGN